MVQVTFKKEIPKVAGRRRGRRGVIVKNEVNFNLKKESTMLKKKDTFHIKPFHILNTSMGFYLIGNLSKKGIKSG